MPERASAPSLAITARAYEDRKYPKVPGLGFNSSRIHQFVHKRSLSAHHMPITVTRAG